jgi:putative ABC transport system permease protein
LDDLVAHKYANIKSEQTKDFRLDAQKLLAVQLDLSGNDTNNRLPRMGYYFLSFLAAIIMILACLNYTNLSVARALTRAKEIGVRKVTGASRKSLIFQFLSESVITAMLALAMAIILLLFIAPAFKSLWVNQYLNFELPSTLSVYLVFFGFALLIGIIAGLYPAFHLSTYKPIQALKDLNSVKPGRLGLRKVLSVTQFVVSLFFITTSILIHNQFRHFVQFDYGFVSKDIVNVELQGADPLKLTNELGAVPGVSAISATDIIPSTGRSNGIQLKKADSTKEVVEAHIMNIDENFIGNLGLQIIAGKNLPKRGESSERFIVVNESAAKKLGYRYPSEIIGEVFDAWGESLEVVGVVENFRSDLLINTHEIGPLVLRNQPSQFMYLNVKINSRDRMTTVTKLEQKWKEVDPIHPFKYEFFEDQLAETHQGIFDVVSIIGFIAFLAISIACLGLLGMATYTAERKTKEVGIRKVLGAEEFSIAVLLSREFLKMLTISVCIGAPLSYLINNFWLQKFPNRVDFGWGTLLLGTVVLVVLGLVTIASQTIRASRRNPVDALKME